MNTETELDIFISDYRKLLEQEKLSIQSCLLSGAGIGEYSDYRFILGHYLSLEKSESMIHAVYEQMAQQLELKEEK